MTIQALRVSDKPFAATVTNPVHLTDDIRLRADVVASVAATYATDVDAAARFPTEAIEAARAQRLLGLQIPQALGGEGAPVRAVADVCYTLGRSCASSAMIFAMHQTKIACIVRHGSGHAWQDALMARIARDQLLLASSTTEGQNGGNVRSSAAWVEAHGESIELERAATVISYGAEADGVVTLARRSAEAAKSDQVLVVFLKDDYTLERLNGWDTLGMRGTCSAGFKMRAKAGGDQIVPERYETIHALTMTPVSHILWSSVWAGIAAAAVERAQGFVRHATRQAGGQTPPGAPRHGQALSSLRALRALIGAALDRFASAEADPRQFESIDFQTSLTMLKVESSELAVATVMSAMRACGLAGYRQDGDFSLGRHLRDILSSPVMIHNDRITANTSTAALMASVPKTLGA